MNKKIISKIRSSSGESIAETMVAVLIAAFALLMLAAMIRTSSRLITQSGQKMSEYYAENNEVAEQTGSEASIGELTVTIQASGSSDTDEGTVNGYKNDLLSKDVISYGS